MAITRELVRIAHSCGVSVEAEIATWAAPRAGSWKPATWTPPSTPSRRTRSGSSRRRAWTPSPSPSARCTGLFKGTPKIDTERLDQIRELVKIPLVLHGGSGLPESEFRAAIEHGINKINFFTGLSLAASGAIDAKLKEFNGKIHYIELINAAHEACKAAVKEQMRIFGTLPLDI